MPRAKRFRPEIPKEIKFFDTEKFKALNRKWHKKLETSGFEDAEEFEGLEDGRMKSHHNAHFKPLFETGEFEDRSRYFELAAQLLHTYKFKCSLDRKIWALHSDGTPEREITVKLKDNSKCTYAYVRRIIKEVKVAIKRDAKDIIKDLKELGEFGNNEDDGS